MKKEMKQNLKIKNSLTIKVKKTPHFKESFSGGSYPKN